MSRYIAFLRAINVGGTTIIKMSDLKKMFESFSVENVETYIQTGNVVFESKESSTSTLEKRIERQLEQASGKKIRLFVRTMRELAGIVKNCPFEPKEGETVHVVILEKKPTLKNTKALLAIRNEADDFAVKGKEVYNLRHDREKSVFTNNLVEKILGVSGTTRNLTTIKKINDKYQ